MGEAETVASWAGNLFATRGERWRLIRFTDFPSLLALARNSRRLAPTQPDEIGCNQSLIGHWGRCG